MTLDKATKQIKLLETNLKEALARKLSIQMEMETLERAGMLNAGVTWHQGKYLYLIEPAKDGEDRKRTYVGKKPEKVQEALARVDRFKRHELLANSLDALDNAGAELSYILGRAVNVLKAGGR